MKLVWKLLRQNINKTQLAGFFFTNLLGMTILLLSVQFYSDVSPLLRQKDTLFKKDYFVVAKKMGTIASLTQTKSVFSESEIEEIRKQPFIGDVGIFTPSRFNVQAGINAAGAGLTTEMFFESVPTEFIDVETDKWRFAPGDSIIPVILPKNYIDLYNFGFGESRNMPKINSSMLAMVNFDIWISGNGDRQHFKGNIVGLSTRLNTILAPESFLLWANNRFGAGNKAPVSRLIVEISNITDPAINAFFEQKHYDIDAGNTAASRLSFFLTILTIIVASIGAVICLLSFFLLTLSIFLLLEKNMTKLLNLRLLGYSRHSVCRLYIVLAVVLNAAAAVVAWLLTLFLQKLYTQPLANVFADYSPQVPLWSALTGTVLFLLFAVCDYFIITRKVK
jgi:hypothetical protein